VPKNKTLRDRAFKEISYRKNKPKKNISAKQNLNATPTWGKWEGIEMEILIIGGAFFGAVLGRFFKVLVLMPAATPAIALLLVRREIAGPTLLDSFLGIGLLIASLELGYVTGLISTDISAATQDFR
jgi:hypothetical protein